MKSLDGIRVVSTALNLPGPVACARMRDLGATVAKVEPPEGDPLESYRADWYRRLHAGMEIGRLDLKSEMGQRAMARLLEGADILVTAQRPSALARMGLRREDLAQRYPRLCHVAVTGHGAPREEAPGHDLTYLAEAGLVSPPKLPATLFADMAGAERTVSAALALVVGRDRGASGRFAAVALADVANDLAAPLREGLTAAGAILGGKLAGYNLYASSDGWIAVAALEPRFARGLAVKFGLAELSIENLRGLFAAHTAQYWQDWGREHDLPIVAVRHPSASHPDG